MEEKHEIRVMGFHEMKALSGSAENESGGVSAIPDQPVRALPANRQGRDFVVGDLHGCFSLLDRLLDHVRFDPACDRLFSVGDLVDRGPDSLRCIEYLDMPWFHAVKGNHETMLLEFFEPYLASGTMDDWNKLPQSDVWLDGGEWVEACYRPDERRMTESFDQLLQRLRSLPLIWVVGEGAERFHVLHAETIRPGYRKHRQKVWLDADIDRWLAGEPIDRLTREGLVWGRTLLNSLAGPRIDPMYPGLSTTYCGHTIAGNVRAYWSHVCLDTGAYLPGEGFGLTLYSVHERRWLRVAQGSAGVHEAAWSPSARVAPRTVTH